MTALNPSHVPDSGYMGDPKRGASLGRVGFRSRSEHLAAMRAESELLESLLNSATGKTLSDLATAKLYEYANELTALRLEIANLEAEPFVKWHLQRMTLDRGGYDRGGAYWGIGMPLWVAFTKSGESMYVRALGRTDARALVVRENPDAKFFK